MGENTESLVAAVTPGSWVWIVLGLAGAIVYMAHHFKERHAQDRQDRKEEREALLTTTREMGQVVKDNTAAMVDLAALVRDNTKATDAMHRMVADYIRTPH